MGASRLTIGRKEAKKNKNLPADKTHSRLPPQFVATGWTKTTKRMIDSHLAKGAATLTP